MTRYWLGTLMIIGLIHQGWCEDQKKTPSRPASGLKLTATPLNKLRQEAVRESALIYGLRQGLEAETGRIQARLETHQLALSQIYNFTNLLIELSGDLWLLPPVVVTADKGVLLAKDGRVAALADKTYRLVETARLVLQAPRWQDYLLRPIKTFEEISPALSLKDNEEQMLWDQNVETGYQQGCQQARDIFDNDLQRLQRDFIGQINYHRLLKQGLVTPPSVIHQKRGTTGDKVVLRLGDQEIEITIEAAFQQRHEQWSPQLF